MSQKLRLCLLSWFGLMVCGWSVHAADLQPFTDGSMQSVEQRYQDRAFVVAIWSLTCPPCMHELEMLSEWQRLHPNIPLVLISTDVDQDQEQVTAKLAKDDLIGADNWVFSDSYVEKLRFQIDPAWHGELPRSYLYSAGGERVGISGRLTKPILANWLSEQKVQQ